MRGIPSFTATQDIQETGIVPSTVGRSLSQLAQTVQGAAEKNLLQEQVEKAKVAGSLAGSNLGFKVVPGTGMAQQEFNQAGLIANKQLLSSDIQLQIPEFQRQSMLDNPTNTRSTQRS